MFSPFQNISRKKITKIIGVNQGQNVKISARMPIYIHIQEYSCNKYILGYVNTELLGVHSSLGRISCCESEREGNDILSRSRSLGAPPKLAAAVAVLPDNEFE
jgi:hypothetical protein